MKVEIYESSITDNRYIFIELGTFPSAKLPEPVFSPPFKTDEVEAGKKYVGADGMDIIAGIKGTGYYCVDVEIRTNETTF